MNIASGFPKAKTDSNKASATSGRSAETQRGMRLVDSALISASLLDIEEPHPTQLGKFTLMRMKHVATLLEALERKLEDSSLRLALHDGVNRFQRRRKRGAVVVVVEEISVQVKRVDRVEFGNVDQINSLKLIASDWNRFIHVGKRDGVSGIDLVVPVEIRIEAIHNHHHLVHIFVFRVLRVASSSYASLVPSIATWVRIDDEGAVETFVNVAFQRDGVAVVEVAAHRKGIKFIDRAFAWVDHPVPCPRHTVLRSSVNSVEVNSVRDGFRR